MATYNNDNNSGFFKPWSSWRFNIISTVIACGRILSCNALAYRVTSADRGKSAVLEFETSILGLRVIMCHNNIMAPPHNDTSNAVYTNILVTTSYRPSHHTSYKYQIKRTRIDECDIMEQRERNHKLYSW